MHHLYIKEEKATCLCDHSKSIPLLSALKSSCVRTRSNAVLCYRSGVFLKDAGLFSSMKENIHREEIHFFWSSRARTSHQPRLLKSRPSPVLSPPRLPQGNQWEMPKLTREAELGSPPSFKGAIQISNS